MIDIVLVRANTFTSKKEEKQNMDFVKPTNERKKIYNKIHRLAMHRFGLIAFSLSGGTSDCVYNIQMECHANTIENRRFNRNMFKMIIQINNIEKT